jgi:hypothetical protein
MRILTKYIIFFTLDNYVRRNVQNISDFQLLNVFTLKALPVSDFISSIYTGNANLVAK